MTEYDNTDPETFAEPHQSPSELANALGNVGHSLHEAVEGATNALSDVAKARITDSCQRELENALMEAAHSGDSTPRRVVFDADSILTTKVDGEPLNRLWDEPDRPMVRVRVVAAVSAAKREGVFTAYYNDEPTRVHVEIDSWPSGAGHSRPAIPNASFENFEPYPAPRTDNTHFAAFEFSAPVSFR